MPLLDTIEGLWYRKDPGWGSTLIRVLLTPAAFVYRLFMTSRRNRYLQSPALSAKAEMPVISIGNLTVGGSGKTPTTMLIAKCCREIGKRPAIISRGYKGALEGQVALVSDGEKVLLNSQQAGDEPVMLAHALPGVPVIIGAKRVEAAAYAKKHLNVDCLILDDAFQHLAIRRDLDILCVNGELGFGNGQTLPAGPLREPLTASKTAGLCLINHYGPAISGIEEALQQNGFVGKTVYAHHRLKAFRNIAGGKEEAVEDWVGKKVFAFAGIAHPLPFFESLEQAEIELAGSRIYPDHFSYQIKELNLLSNLAKPGGITYYVTTEKDAVKLMDLGHDLPMEIWAAISKPSLSEESKRRIIDVLKEVL